MSDTLLAVVLTPLMLAALLLWVPLMHSVESLSQRYPLRHLDDMPNLVEEEDISSHFKGEIA